jgi:hypothetical protein
MSKAILLAAMLASVPVPGIMVEVAVAATDSVVAHPAESRTQSIVTATNAFLDSLSAEQRAKVLFAFSLGKTAGVATFKGGLDGRMNFVGEKYDDSVWSNFPVSDVPRPGLAMGNLNASQRDAVMHLLQTLLSTNGCQKVQDIMGSDQALADSGVPFAAGLKAYTIGIFGQPSATAPWMVQFGGHHLALNITIVGGKGVLAPVLTGVQPAIYTSNGKTVRVLAKENDKAFDLLNSLDENQRKQAILPHHVPNLVFGPGHDGETIAPEGLKASAMTEEQRVALLDLVTQWAVSSMMITRSRAWMKLNPDFRIPILPGAGHSRMRRDIMAPRISASRARSS